MSESDQLELLKEPGETPSYFCNPTNQLLMRMLGTKPNTGFRPGQLGALHSTIAHFSVNEDPAVISLPTGYGKTAVIMALPFVFNASRVLVVEPTDVLRKQTANHFKSVHTLRKLGVVQKDAPNPAVWSIKGYPADWRRFEKYDVLISTPNSSSPVKEPKPPADFFDLIIFDEAHHAPAETWAAYLSHFTTARFVFLTATPFRRDKKVIPGKLAYRYPVSKAAREKAFGKVKFVAAPVANELDDAEIDRSVAKTAADQFKADRAAGLDHRLLVRAQAIKSVTDLAKLYEAQGLKVAAIHSGLPPAEQDECENKLLKGELDGIVCVDMFGEGYDFPKLKVAALHAPHRSLVPTLQFIGRFARTNDESTGDATLVAPIARLKDANRRLFQEGIDIGELIDETAQAEIADSEADREILEALQPVRQIESDYDAVTPLALELYAHTRIFECDTKPDFTKFGTSIGKNLMIAKQWSTKDDNVALLLTIDHSPPNWATAEVLANVRHDAFLFVYSPTTKLCHIGSTRRTEKLYLQMMNAICPDSHRPISYERTRRAMAGLDALRFYNVGLKNTALNTQAESYRVLTGPAAERSLNAGDGRSFVQGHVFGSGFNDGERETIGASSSSRVWSNQRLSVAEYIEWVELLGARISGAEEISASLLDIVSHSKQLSDIPTEIIAGVWPKDAYRRMPKIRYRVPGNAWSVGVITDFEIVEVKTEANRKSAVFHITNGNAVVSYRFTVTGGNLVVDEKNKWEVELESRYDDWISLSVWMSTHTPSFFAADKSFFEGVNYFPPAQLTLTTLPDGACVTIDWTGCSIVSEADLKKGQTGATVHQHLQAFLQAQPGIVALAYDHRSGEAADFILCQTTPNDECIISLYHCKGAGGAPDGTRVADVYEVNGQIVKSIAYCDGETLIKHLVHRTNANKHQHPTRFVTGDLEAFRARVEGTPASKTRFEIYGVQPGILQDAIDAHLADLMAFGIDYAKRGGAADAKWIVSG